MQTFFSIVKSFTSWIDLSRFACIFVPGLAKMMRPDTLMLRKCARSYTKKADHHGQPFILLEHLWFVVLLYRSLVAVAARTSWASVVAAWATVTSAVVAARATLTVVTAWTSVSAWLALRLYISLRLLEEGLA